MKIGIITLWPGTNYGNRLQIYAVQQVLKGLGVEAQLIKGKTGVHGFLFRLKKIIKILINYRGARYCYRRERSFRCFDAKYIKIAKYAYDEHYRRSDLGKKFDVFLCGSDQIWNPYYTYLNGGCFADFPGAKKRISYSASFGVSEVPQEQKAQFREWLNGMDAISVREQSGKEIVEELTDKKATVLIDPTMMLSAEDWRQIAENPGAGYGKKYVLKYFLGGVTPEVQVFLEKICERYDLEIVDVVPDKSEKNYELNPSHFVYLLDHARLVVTDSFHASVFAILFQKPLRIFDRVEEKLDMSTRIDMLLSFVGDKGLRNNKDLEIDWNFNYSVDEKLQMERSRAKEFLIKAIAADIKQ